MSRALAVVGLQWGDEGKGKIVDWLSAKADFTVRFQGGNNAGHTILVDGEQSILHLVPSGILHERATCLIGQGVVLNPWQLLAEIDGLEAKGVDASERIRVSGNCSLILPYHISVDEARERSAGGIGTTKRGIGPAHEDKAGRRALRLWELFADRLEDRLGRIAEHHNHMLTEMYGAPAIDPDEVRRSLERVAPRLRPLCADIPAILDEARRGGRNVLLEGAQGALLDCEHGTYPYVTSSSCLASAAVSGAGIDLQPIVIGVAKAYATRVGNGPFPTENHGETGGLLLRRGREYGATTGRQRRCGWLDLPALRYALALNGCTRLCLTKIDVLDALDTIRVCVGYGAHGTDSSPQTFSMADFTSGKGEPVYEDLPGWRTETSGLRRFEEAPERMRSFLSFVEERTGAQVSMASVGAERRQTLLRDPEIAFS